MKKFFLLFNLLLLSSLGAWAQVHLNAYTDKTDLALDDELTLTVQVSGVSGNMVMPQLPSLPAFNVYSRQAAQSTINGKTTLSFKYLMMPRFVGNTTIGPVTFNYGGKTYQTKSIPIRIYKTVASVPAAPARQTQKSTPAAPEGELDQLPPLERELGTRAYAHVGEPYFMVAAVSNKTPYLNEPFTLAVRFYYSQPFYDAPYQNPTVSNLLLEELPASQGQQTLQNTIYRYEEKRYRLTPVSAGKAHIGPAQVTYHAGSLNGSLFDRFFGGSAVSPAQTASSKAMNITVKNIPAAGKPNSFYGAVGSGYTLSAQLDRAQTQAGDAVTLSATVQGPGNLKTSGDLTFPQITGLTAYAAAPQAGYLPGSTAKSYKTFKTVLVPTASGTYTIAPVAWSYFDPQTHTYKTLYTRPLTLEVSPAAKAAVQLDFGKTDGPSAGVESLGQDIHYVLSAPAPGANALEKLGTWQWAHALALMWIAGCLFMASIGKKTAAKKHAYLHAKNQLKKATTYEDISDALATYLLGRFHISTARLPLKDILHALAKARVSGVLCQQFASLWQALESARFAPAAHTPQELAGFTQRAIDLLKKLEQTK